MRHSIRILALAICASLASAPLFAGTPIDQTRPLDARGRVEISNLKGSIEVHAWERNEVRITGELGKGVKKLVVDGGGDDLEVRVEYPDHRGWRDDDRSEPTRLVLQVPLRASLDIESVSADVTVDGVASGELDIQAVSGNITVAGAPSEADINSVSGDLSLTLNSASVDSESVSGDIVLSGRLDGDIEAETVSGDIRIDSRGERVRRLSTGTVSGDADVRVGLADGGEISSETVSGDIRLHLPKNLSARVSGESFNGDLSAPGAKVHTEEFGPGKSLEARYGNGSGEIRLESFSGDAVLTLE
jgi:hypothetical protein